MNIEQKIKYLIHNRLKKEVNANIDDVTIVSLNRSDYDNFIEFSKVNEADFNENEPVFLGKKVILSNSNGPSRIYIKTSKMSKALGIIGTAGRNDDINKLGNLEWEYMVEIASKMLIGTCSNTIVSGGAAWADHVAVHLYLHNKNKLQLKLRLPADFIDGKFSENNESGRVANYYHRIFSEKIGIDSLGQISESISSGCDYVCYGGFKERNFFVANDSGNLLAFTFGEDKKLKLGGTKNTFDTFLEKENRGLGIHINLNNKESYVY